MNKKDTISEETKLANEARNAYYREYRKNNKDKVKKANHNYWLKKSKELKGE